jgi:hypothetical protein
MVIVGGNLIVEKDISKRRRPFGLYMIAGLQLVLSIMLALALLGEKTIATYLKVLIQNPIFYSWFGWVLAGSLILSVLGLMILKRWAWILTMILTGLGLSYSIWSYFQENPHYIPMVIYLVIVFYLNQREVQSAFSQPELDGGIL